MITKDGSTSRIWGAKTLNRFKLNFCVGVAVRDVIKPAKFGDHRLRG